MAAPKGNQYAFGNKGGRRPNAEFQEKVDTFKGLVLDYVLRVMQTGTERQKADLVLKSLIKVLPEQMNVAGNLNVIIKKFDGD